MTPPAVASSLPALADARALTRALVRVDSRNPDLVPGAPGEDEAARLLARVLTAWGFAVERYDAAPGRPNVVARIGRGEPGAPTLMLNGHLDVVGTEGMAHAPFDAEERDGLLYGRGAADMKGGVAAMCAAAARAHAAGAVRGTVLVAAVADEEFESAGTRALVARLAAAGTRVDGCVITEPTRLAIMPAHRGFAWYTATLHGRAAHGSRHDLGVDAIRHAGLLLAELDALDADELPRRAPHPLLGRGSLHASLVHGGVGVASDFAGPDPGQFKFGTSFAFVYGLGARYVPPGTRWSLRADLGNSLYRLRYPNTYSTPALDSTSVLPARARLTRWLNNTAITAGVSYQFRR